MVSGTANTAAAEEARMTRTIQDEVAAMDAQVVDGFRVGELRAAFRKVENLENWKLAIDATVTATERELEAIRRAVVFFAGCVATVEPLGGRRFRVRAVGYYVAVGA